MQTALKTNTKKIPVDLIKDFMLYKMPFSTNITSFFKDETNLKKRDALKQELTDTTY